LVFLVFSAVIEKNSLYDSNLIKECYGIVRIEETKEMGATVYCDRRRWIVQVVTSGAAACRNAILNGAKRLGPILR
jgi:hypothetical protein